MQSDQVLIEPAHSLQERLLLGELLNLLACITPDREPMGHTAVQIDLVRLFGLNEDSLRLVALLSWENLVCFCGSDGERSSDGSELGFLDE